ncbi:uncharacterized protein EI97DRAFT_445059 [Westerdykella ornata]|uniref:Uncharacterized protein n=1 Tax=Westerdykella ornata TaxID=318751 RepID=A0A6A6JAR5_WESOR|nr:uncharacterized protein EI97DRAFT_445059 [Westerdykella ornata]KAF2273324.1 hypothetical protein EI97DRAFT_445059 [Westerdykella ornata]
MPTTQLRHILTKIPPKPNNPTTSPSPTTSNPTTPPLTPQTFSSLLPTNPEPLAPTIHDWLRSSSPPAKHPRPHAYYEPMVLGSVKPRKRSSKMAHERSPDWRGMRGALRVFWDGDEEEEEERGRGRTRMRLGVRRGEGDRNGEGERRNGIERGEGRGIHMGPQAETTVPGENAQVEREARLTEPVGLAGRVQLRRERSGSRLPGNEERRMFKTALVAVDRRKERRAFHGALLQVPARTEHRERGQSQDPRAFQLNSSQRAVSAVGTTDEAGQSSSQGTPIRNEDGKEKQNSSSKYLQVPPLHMTRGERERHAQSQRLRESISLPDFQQATSVSKNGQDKPLPPHPKPYILGERPTAAVPVSRSSGESERVWSDSSGVPESSLSRPTELMYDVGPTAMKKNENDQSGEVVVGDVRIPKALVPGRVSLWMGKAEERSLSAGPCGLAGSVDESTVVPTRPPQIGALDVGDGFQETLARFTRGRL